MFVTNRIDDNGMLQNIKQQLQISLDIKTSSIQRTATVSGSVQESAGTTQSSAATPAYSVSISSAGLAISSVDTSPQYAKTPIDYTNNIKLTGNKTLDPLLAAGNYWWNTGVGADGSNPSTSADHTITYSFLADATGLSGNDANGFQSLTASQQNVIRDAFTYISTVVDITFTEVGSGGQINLGSNTQGGASAGYAYYPNSGSTGGDVFLANDQATFQDAASWNKGGYTWETVLHEIGHALGLKHPGNYNAGGGGTPKPYLSRRLDTRTNTIMSYNNDIKQMHLVESNGSGGLASSYVNPDSYQTLDIAALQYLYGAATTSSSTTYTFTDGEKISRTIYDTNSSSAIDLTGMTQSNVIDLRGGHFSSIGIRDPYADTGMTKDQYKVATSGGVKLSKLLGTPTYSGANNLAIAAGSKIQTAIGGNNSDTLISGSEIGGSAQLDGGAGDDYYFIASGDAVISDTSGTNDSVYVAKNGRTIWSVDAGHTTLTQTDKKTGATLSTIDIAGIEHVGFWNGRRAKIPRSTRGLMYSPPEQKQVIAYDSSAMTLAKGFHATA
jgi:Matrixin